MATSSGTPGRRRPRRKAEGRTPEPVDEDVNGEPGGIVEARPPAHEPAEPCRPEDDAADCLQLCRVDPFPADRVVPSAVFVPASAEDHDPIRVAFPSSSPLARRRVRRQHRGAHLDGLEEAAAVFRAALERVQGRDVALGYLDAMVGGALPAALAPAAVAMYQDIGYLLLDRIRMRPCGTIAGDLVYTLGLAPTERVVLTQKAWTKRNVSLEETIAEQLEHELEFSSAFSTEIGENTEHQQQRQTSSTVNAAVSASYGPIGASVSYGTSASDSSGRTSQQSSKRAREQTRKATDRAKKEHRITFKTETESGIEDISQRTFENPNTCHSLMLNFFKVFQRFRVYSERWGIRACWAPAVLDPGRDLRTALQDPERVTMTDEERAHIDGALTWDPPDMPPRPASQTLRSNWSARVTAGIAGYRDDVSTTIDIPADHSLLSLAAERRDGMTWGTVDVPWKPGHGHPPAGATGQQEVWWHVGLADCNLFAGCNEPWAHIRTVFEVAPSSELLSGWTEQLNQKRQAEYARRQKEVQDRIDAQNKAADDAAKAAADAANKRVAQFDPWTELMRRIVAERLTPERYNSATEVTLWNDVFEWESASYELFPNWWNGHEPTGKQSQPTGFLNASWARLYVPIRPGLEMVAFQLLFGAEAAALQGFVDDLASFRDAQFGPPSAETVIRLADWEELMPTDGTLVEPVLGNCSACDDQLAGDLAAQRALVEAQAAALTERPKKPASG